MLVALVTQKEKLKAWTGVRRLAAGVRVWVQKARKGKDSGMQVQAVLSYLRVHGLVDGSPPVGTLLAFCLQHRKGWRVAARLDLPDLVF
jgi:hypothetical protein